MIGDIEYIGVMRVNSPLICTDPCYTEKTWCTVILNDVKHGEWTAEYSIIDGGRYGKRVSSLHLTMDVTNPYECVEFAGECGVDSGTCGIFNLGDFTALNKDNKVKDAWYDRNVVGTCYKSQAVQTDEGVFSEAGYGDGSYPVFVARDENNEIVEIEIVFISDEEEDE